MKCPGSGVWGMMDRSRGGELGKAPVTEGGEGASEADTQESRP